MMGHQWDNETPWNYSIFEYLWVYFKSRSSIIFETKYVQYSVVVACSLKHDLIFKYIGGPSGVDLWPGSLNLYDQRCEPSLVPRLWYDWLGTHDYLELLSIGLSNCIWNNDSLVNPTVSVLPFITIFYDQIQRVASGYSLLYTVLPPGPPSLFSLLLSQ